MGFEPTTTTLATWYSTTELHPQTRADYSAQPPGCKSRGSPRTGAGRLDFREKRDFGSCRAAGRRPPCQGTLFLLFSFGESTSRPPSGVILMPLHGQRRRL